MPAPYCYDDRKKFVRIFAETNLWAFLKESTWQYEPLKTINLNKILETINCEFFLQHGKACN